MATRDEFEALFSSSTDGSGNRAPRTAWDELWEAHLWARPVRVTLGARTLLGWSVTYGTLPGVLHEAGAPAEWQRAAPPEVEAWVLRSDRDQGLLEFVAFSPKTGTR